MKAKESLLHKNLRAVVQSSIQKEASAPCGMFWNYQPHRPEKPLTNPQGKKYISRCSSKPVASQNAAGFFVCSVGQQLAKGCYALSSRKR